MKNQYLYTAIFVVSFLLVGIQPSMGAISIPTDISVGTWDDVTRVYTLTTDVDQPIHIDKDNLTLDGAGHKVIGPSTEWPCRGVYLKQRRGVTLKNMHIEKWRDGIYLSNSAGNTITGNIISSNSVNGVWLNNSDENVVSNNDILYNGLEGVRVYRSNNNVFSGNTFHGNAIYLYYSAGNRLFNNSGVNTRIFIAHSSNNNIVTENTIIGGPYGIEVCNRSNGNVLAGNTISGGGIAVTGSDNNVLRNNTVSNSSSSGIFLFSCSGNTLEYNTTSNTGRGISLWHSSNNNTVMHNSASNSNTYGIHLIGDCCNNVLMSNSVLDNGQGDVGVGIKLCSGCSYNTLIGNTISRNPTGIYLRYSSQYNTLVDNIVSQNTTGICIQYASWNQIYNNNFIDNLKQARVYYFDDNVFNPPKPIGGNFWSDWTTPDADHDGFVDFPYVFYADQDNLPWALPDGWANKPPEADAGHDQTIEQESYAGTDFTLDGSGSTDPDSTENTNDDIVSFAWYEGAIYLGSGETINYTFPLGSHTVTLVVTDFLGETDEDEVIVVVQDTTLPELTCPADVTVEQESYDGTVVPLEATATDICDPDPVITSDELAIYPLGVTVVTFTATDASGNSASCSMTVTVVDTTVPTINSISASPDVLWAPNHKMVEVMVKVDAEDICDPVPFCYILKVTSNEPINGPGDGNTEPDWEHTDEPLVVLLRAERAGSGTGRIYTILVECIDISRNIARATAKVVVPHDQSE